MNICAVAFFRPDTASSGIEVTLWKLSTTFARQGCRAHIVFNCATSPDSMGDQIVGKVRLHGVGPKRSLPVVGQLAFELAAVRKLRELGESEDIDVYSFHGPLVLGTLLLSKKLLFKRPIVYHTYAALPFEAKTYLLKSFKPIPYFLRKLKMYASHMMYEFLAIRCVDQVIVASLATVEEFKKYYRCPEGKISVVPLGQDLFDRYGQILAREKSEWPTCDEKRLLFVGNDWHRKGVKHLFLAFKEVIKKVPNTTLTMTGPHQKTFALLAEKLNLEDHIFYAGNIGEETLARFYAECDVFVLPSFHEGFSNTLIEAMSFGKPVVTTPIAGYPVVEDKREGFLVKPGDQRSLAVSIVKLLRNRNLLEQMGKNAKERAGIFTWTSSAKKALEIYDTLTAKKRI